MITSGLVSELCVYLQLLVGSAVFKYALPYSLESLFNEDCIEGCLVCVLTQCRCSRKGVPKINWQTL